MRLPLDVHQSDQLLGYHHLNLAPARPCNREASSPDQRAVKTTDTTIKPLDIANLTTTPSPRQSIGLMVVMYKVTPPTTALMGMGTMTTKNIHHPTFHPAEPLLWLGVGVSNLIFTILNTSPRV